MLKYALVILFYWVLAGAAAGFIVLPLMDKARDAFDTISRAL